MYITIQCAIFMDLNIDLISFGRGKTSVFFSSLSALVRLYQCVQHRCQYLSKFISTYSKIISLCQSFSALSELISNGLRQSRFRFKFYTWYGVHARRFIYKTLSISNINMDAEENSRYISWAVSKLKQELIARGASTRGRKTDLIERYYTQLWFEWKSLIIVLQCNGHL